MEIKDLQNSHEGEHAVIVGNGPSLKETPLEELENYTTFGLNRINIIFDNTSWRPDYYLFQGIKKHNRYRDDALDVINRGITAFIQEDKKHLYPDYDNVVHFPRVQCHTEELLEKIGVNSIRSISHEDINKIVDELWSTNMNDQIYAYRNSMIPLGQIVANMGFSKIYFVGCDGYIKQQPYMIFDSGSDPCGYTHKSKYKNNFRTYLDFLLSNGKPLRSFVNGLSYIILKSKWTPTWLESKISKDNYVKEDYHKDAARFWLYQKKNYNLKIVHKIIEKAGERHGFETFNATINGNIDIHKSVDIENIIRSSTRN